MKMFDKIKDLFTDEIEIEEPVKKEVIQVEIPAPKVVPKEEPEEPKKMVDTSAFFDDLDFEDISKVDHDLDVIYKAPEKPIYKEEKKEAYNPKKEQPKKHFEPTPIISPVYGVLDKNYKKDDIVNKAETPVAHKDMTIDDVRNKAYGTLEDELESTLFGRTAILFQNDEKKEDYKDIEKDLKDTAEAIDLLTDDIDEVVETKEEKPKHVKKEVTEEEVKTAVDDLPLEDTMITDALKIEPEEEKISESELFNLIDDIYGKGDNK
ncbi:MAG: hypothetical protein IJ565_04370 [Bacilli bacterium]|nr:hypothetical protein [Bacilli bacterium]